MASIADLEQFLEQIFERSSARLFRTRVQVVQIERRVERAMERSRSGHGARTSVPAHFAVRLHPDDMADVAPTPADAQALAATLADAALSFARSHAYHLPGRPTVALLTDAGIDRGRVVVDPVPGPSRRRVAEGVNAEASEGVNAEASEGVNAEASAGVAEAAADGNEPPPGRAAPSTDAEPPLAVRVAIEADPLADRGGDVAAASAVPIDDARSGPEPREPGGIRGDGTQTVPFRRPAPEAARAVLRVLTTDGSEAVIEVDGHPLTVGRSPDNVVVLRDARVSRRHGRLQARHGTLVYTDLGSTNGSWVNGIRVDEIALGLGDRLLVGDTVMVVETLPD
jgi:hypothetical protein